MKNVFKRAFLPLVIPGLVTTGASAQETNVYWGDTHMHTGNSFDVYLFGTPTSDWDTAYRFAQGLPVINPTTGTRWQLHTPLDFLVISDHAELMGALPRLFSDDPVLNETRSGKIIRKMAPRQTEDELLQVYKMFVRAGSGEPTEQGVSAADLVQDLHGGDKRKAAWETYTDLADDYNQPGQFTTLIGWEWSAMPRGGGNMHRVIFTPQDAKAAQRFLPYSQFESENEEDLWAWLTETSETLDVDFVAIPHNPNISMGQMFPLVRYNDEPVDADYAGRRMQWEQVVEVTQIKGDSEAHPLLSPTDEYADYETYPFVLTADGGSPDPTEGDYLRSGLKRGLEFRQQFGVNPYKFGMIGSTDSHTGISAIGEDNFAGKGQHDAIPERRQHPTGLGTSKGWDMGAAGLAGVWARKNTRDSLVAAFKRREVYASTGPRITLRFFGGFNFNSTDARSGSIAEVGYRKGVPMGGDLSPQGKKAPTFLVAAAKDPIEGNLDRIQIVKGWVDSQGEAQEKIYNVALSDGRQDGAQKVGNTVNLKTGEYSNTIGAEQLTAFWEDPDFDPAQNAFYYARVLQIPTPRYSLLDSIALGIDWADTNRPATIQERAYSSPIWFSP